MAANTVEVKGLADVLDKLQSLTPDLEKKVLVKAAKATADIFTAEAKLHAPVEDEATAAHHGGKYPHRSGALKDSIRTVKKRKPAKGSVLGYETIAGNSEAFYARFLEFGFHNVKSGTFVQVPFLRPAFDTKSDEALDKFTDIVKTAIDRMQDGKVS